MMVLDFVFNLNLICFIYIILFYLIVLVLKIKRRSIYEVIIKIIIAHKGYYSISSSFNLRVSVFLPQPNKRAASCLCPCVYFRAQFSMVFSSNGIASLNKSCLPCCREASVHCSSNLNQGTLSSSMFWGETSEVLVDFTISCLLNRSAGRS
ncbi:nitrogen regulation protein NR(I) [Providencia rustigianii]